MEEFLVLGIVPNTNIQVTFYDWLLIAQVLLLLVLVAKMLSAKLSVIRAAKPANKV